MNRSQLQQKISRRSSKQKLRDDALLKQMEKNPALDAVLQPSPDDAALSGGGNTSFHARAYFTSRTFHLVVPKIAALNAGLLPNSTVEVTIRRLA